MANREKGQISIEIEGEEYTLSMDLDAMCAVEELFSRPERVATFQQIVDLADRGSMTHLRALIWSVLRTHHPSLAIKDIGRLVERAGGPQTFLLKLAELAGVSAPDPRDTKELGIPETPRKAQARRGTGARSNSTRAGLA
jgi:hypothetical protein